MNLTRPLFVWGIDKGTDTLDSGQEIRADSKAETENG